MVAIAAKPKALEMAVTMLDEMGIRLTPTSETERLVLFEAAGRPRRGIEASLPRVWLEASEVRLLELIATGISHRDIGKALGVSEDVAKVRARQLYRVLRVAGRAGAVGAGFRMGILGNERTAA